MLKEHHLQEQPHRNRQCRPPAEHDADEAVEQQVNAGDAQIDMAKRRYEKCGCHQRRLGDLFLADPPRTDEGEQRCQGKADSQPRPSQDAVGNMNGPNRQCVEIRHVAYSLP